MIKTVKRCFVEVETLKFLMGLKGVKTTYNPNRVGKYESAVD